MKKTILFLLFTIVFFPNINFGCSCLTPSSFCESITDSNGDIRPTVILRGKITGGTPGIKEIKVNQLIYGEISQSEITIKHGFCTLYFNELEDEKEYVFALTEHDDNFNLMNCAISFLKIENEVIKGKITSELESIDYKELVNLENCGNSFQFISLEKNAILFPNPTSNEIKIKNPNAEISFENLQLKIFDSVGRELITHRKEEGILSEETWKINIENLSAGIYIIKFSAKHQECFFKVIKL